MQYDFRSVYGTVLTDWMGMDRAIVEELLIPYFQNLPILKACQSPVKNKEISYLKEHSLIYPNPTTDEVNLQFISKHSGEALVEVYGTLGERILQRKLHQIEAGRNEIQLSVADFQSGMYFIRLVLGNGLSFTKSFNKV